MKKIRKRGLNLDKLEWVIARLQNDELLSQAYRDHALVGNYVGFRECHIEPDWLLVYAIEKNQLILTGSHSDLF